MIGRFLVLSPRGYTSDYVYYLFSRGMSLAATTQSLEIAENDGFWAEQGIEKSYRSRVETDIRGVGRDISLIFSADSNVIHPFTINTVYIDYALRKKNY